MLFYLLELEYLIARMDVEEAVEHLISTLQQKAEGAISDEEVDKIRSQVRPLLAKTAIEQIVPELTELEEGYHSAVEELSYIAPFIAFRLKGRTRLFQRFGVVKDLMEKVPALDPSIPPDQLEAMGDYFDSLQPNVIKEDLKVIRNELVSLSWRVGPVALWKAKRRIRRSSSLSEDDRKDMEKHVDQLISFMMTRLPNE